MGMQCIWLPLHPALTAFFLLAGSSSLTVRGPIFKGKSPQDCFLQGHRRRPHAAKTSTGILTSNPNLFFPEKSDNSTADMPQACFLVGGRRPPIVIRPPPLLSSCDFKLPVPLCSLLPPWFIHFYLQADPHGERYRNKLSS